MAAAPAESTCSHSGIFTCGAARLTTATTSGRAGEARALVLDLLRRRVGILGDEGVGDRLAGLEPRLALEHDEAPRHELAVIGHPRGDGQQRLDLGRATAPAAAARSA